LCRTFHTVGFCPYGPRCHFVHEDLNRLNPMNDNKTSAAQYPTPNPSPTSSPPAGTQISQHSVSGPTPINRPKALNFSYSVPGNNRDSMGSAGNSPASSVSDSSSLSANSFLIEDFVNASNTITNNAINQHYNNRNNKIRLTEEDLMAAKKLLLSSIAPLNIQTFDPVINLATSLKTMKLNQCLNNCQLLDEDKWNLYSLLRENEMYAPPSPPESLSSGDSGWSSNVLSCDEVSGSESTCDSPSDAGRGGRRLPTFSGFTRD